MNEQGLGLIDYYKARMPKDMDGALKDVFSKKNHTL